MSEAVKCPCGECSNWVVRPEAYLQGVHFTQERLLVWRPALPLRRAFRESTTGGIRCLSN